MTFQVDADVDTEEVVESTEVCHWSGCLPGHCC